MKRIRKPLLLLAASAAVLLGVWGLQTRRTQKGVSAVQVIDAESDGVNLTYLAFNKRNEKKLEVKCERSQKGEDERLVMKKVTATVFKADKLDEDVHVFADSGRTTDDFDDFHLQGNVRIVSPKFTLSSRSFSLRWQNELSTRDAAVFKLRRLTGRANAGLVYVFSHRTMRMVEPEGTLDRAGKPYRFQARLLRLNEKKKRLLLDQEARVAGDGSTLTADRIVMEFDQELANLQEATGSGNCFFQATETAPDGRPRTREITAERIKMTNDPQGRLQSLRISGNGVVSLADEESSGRINSPIIDMSMTAETQAVEKIQTRKRGGLSSQGRRGNFTVEADSLLAVYDGHGELARVKAEGNCVYATDDFSGRAPLLDYDVAAERIVISGKEVTVVSRKNSFVSSEFVIRTRSKALTTDKGVQATLVPTKKSVLLGAKPVYVTAVGLELGRQGETIRFKERVNLFQDEIELHAGELTFENRSNRMECRGGADLQFVNNRERIALQGATMALHPDTRRIVMEGEARLRQGENALAAQKIELAFGRTDELKEITATGSVGFGKKDLTGKAMELLWQYPQKLVQFRKSAEITRKGAGTTRGRELQLNLENNELTVSGADDRAETTIVQDRP